MDRKGLTATVATIAIVLMLFFSGPVRAVQVQLTTDKTSYKANENTQITASVDIEPGENIPVHNLTLAVYNSTGDTVVECKFLPDGSIIGSCTGIQVQKINQQGYGYSNRYGYGYGIEGYSYTSFGYGYGYGYSAGFTGNSGELSYNITLNISNLSSGNYSLDMLVHASGNDNTKIYNSATQASFTIDQDLPQSLASSSQY
ncbi:MAG: hypothetical protein ABIF10_07750, partial [Candidatus Woesearchaeota archaeon]